MNNLLIISYYSNFPGACQAEWIDDKCKSLNKAGYTISLISSLCCDSHSSKMCRSLLIPSISLFDFIDELKLLKKRNKLPGILAFMFFPLIFTLGILIDLLFLIVLKGNGEGRWSWSISSTFAAILSVLIKKPDCVVTTGGPASAHFAGLILKNIFRLPWIIEFQDPLYGNGFGRNSRSQFYFKHIEKLFVSQSSKVVYVTKKAATSAKLRFPLYSHKIQGVYPGSYDFCETIDKAAKAVNSQTIKLIHLGSLYSTRNLRNLCLAIDKLTTKKLIPNNLFQITNLGHVASEFKSELEQKSYVTTQLPVDRISALQKASSFDVLLLIQNDDQRSLETIPYKTYDYLNLKMPIFALSNNDELDSLLSSPSHFKCDCSSPNAIANALISLYTKFSNINHADFPLSINSINQAIEFISI